MQNQAKNLTQTTNVCSINFSLQLRAPALEKRDILIIYTDRGQETKKGKEEAKSHQSQIGPD